MSIEKETNIEQSDEKYTETTVTMTSTAVEESTSTDRKDIFIDDKNFEKKLLRKMDLRIMPLLTLLYLLSFLDRVNIGNAKLANIEKDLGLTGNQFNLALTVFFIGYILFEVPSNMMLMKSKPSMWISFIMVMWGVIMTLTAFVKNFQGLMAARFFLGLFEAGLFPGAIYFITTWYKRSEHNSRIAIFSAGTTMAGSFSGLLAFGILKLDGKLHLKGWQWLFLIEGLATVVISISAFFLISEYPQNAKWLSEDERKFAVERLKHDAGKAHIEHYDKKQFIAAAKDWKVYTGMLILGLYSIPLYSFALFIPSIINGLGFNPVISQLLSVPPFSLAAIITFAVAVFSDRKRIRSPFIITCSSISILGYVLLLTIPTKNIVGRYMGCIVMASGLAPSIITSISWVTNNVAGHAKRGIATGMTLMSVNIGGIIGSLIYRPQDFPNFAFGHSIAMSCLIVATSIAILQYFILRKINKRKRENPKSFLEGKSEEEIKNLGDLHPEFIYSL